MAVNTEEVFKKIEKQNGKMFARVMRGDGSAIPEGSPFRHVNLLDTPDLVNMLRYAGKDPNDAIKLIPVIKEIHDKALKGQTVELEEKGDPIKLLDQAGYKAWYVNDPDDKNKSVEDMVRDQNAIGGYFRSAKAVKYGMTGDQPRTNVNNDPENENGEMICTIYTNLDRGDKRFDENYIINAVKKEADGDDKKSEKEWRIKPSSHPEREDEYGRSVISIQILKTGGAISIKNRYNHTVTDPDHTFNNNPDEIIPGLSEALKQKFGVDFVVSNSKIPENYFWVHNQLIRFNYEVNNVYFGDNFYVNGSDITELNDRNEVMLDNIILDTDFGKKARSVLKSDRNTEELLRVINDEIAGCKVTKATEKGETIITIIDENKKKKEFARVKDGQITSLHLYRTTKLPDCFLIDNKTLRELDAPSLEKMEKACFKNNENLEILNIPELREMRENCFNENNLLNELNAPELEYMGANCFRYDENIEKISVPKLKRISACCFMNGKILKELDAPSLEYIDAWVLSENEKLEKINIPELKVMEDGCFEKNKSLKELDAPSLKKMKWACFQNNEKLEKINIPELDEMGSGCFERNKSLKELDAPKLKMMKEDCFKYNEKLEKLNIPELKEMQKHCFECNKSLKELNAPKLEIMGNWVFTENETLEKINVPELKEMGTACFEKNKSLKELNAPKLENAEKHPFIQRFLKHTKMQQAIKNISLKLGIREATQRDVSIPKDNSIPQER